MNPQMTPVAQINDLVTINGYANRVFRVNSYTHEFTFEMGAEYEDIFYDCACVTNDEYMLGSHEDVTVVCKAIMSERFLSTYEHPKINAINPINIFEAFNVGDYENTEVKAVIKPVEKRKKEPTKQERIDALLDEINAVNETQGFLVAEEGYRERRISEIEAKIREVQAE